MIPIWYNPHMLFGKDRLKRPRPFFWLFSFLLIASCAAPAPASISEPTPASVLSNPYPTPTPFQPQPEASPDPYNEFATPGAVVPTFTPYPTKYVPAQDISVPVDSAPTSDPSLIVYNPLTGLPVTDPTLLQRRPLAIKIGNSPDYVRPQSGLTLADVVYEYYIEWGDTRFIGIFYSNNSERVGPVRSGRYFDEHISRMYHAFVMFKGADPREMDYFRSLDITERFVTVGIGECPPFYYGHYKRDSYNNIFFNTVKWDACARKKGFDNSPQTISGGFFSEDAPQSALTVTRIYNFYSVYNYSYWDYDPINRIYIRYQESKDLVNTRKVEVYQPLMDDYTKQPVTAENVVVLFVPYIFTNQNQAEDEVYNPQLIDYGNAYVFRDGIAIPARWNRTAIDQPILLTNLDGSPIYLRPGQTFYQVMGVTSGYTQNGTEWRFEFATP